METNKLKNLFEGSNDKYADAKAIGTTYQTLYNIIYKGSICKVDLIERIAKFYGVPVGYFFGEVPEESPSLSCPHCGKPIKIKLQ